MVKAMVVGDGTMSIVVLSDGITSVETLLEMIVSVIVRSTGMAVTTFVSETVMSTVTVA